MFDDVVQFLRAAETRGPAEERVEGVVMRSHDQVVGHLNHRAGVRAELDRIEGEECFLLDALLEAREAAGLTRAQVAERMGIQPSAVARLERALVTGEHSPSIATLRRYVEACGKKLVLRVA